MNEIVFSHAILHHTQSTQNTQKYSNYKMNAYTVKYVWKRGEVRLYTYICVCLYILPSMSICVCASVCVGICTSSYKIQRAKDAIVTVNYYRLVWSLYNSSSCEINAHVHTMSYVQCMCCLYHDQQLQIRALMLYTHENVKVAPGLPISVLMPSCMVNNVLKRIHYQMKSKCHRISHWKTFNSQTMMS